MLLEQYSKEQGGSVDDPLHTSSSMNVKDSTESDIDVVDGVV